jgi:hypothetical protein
MLTNPQEHTTRILEPKMLVVITESKEGHIFRSFAYYSDNGQKTMNAWKAWENIIISGITNI